MAIQERRFQAFDSKTQAFRTGVSFTSVQELAGSPAARTSSQRSQAILYDALALAKGFSKKVEVEVTGKLGARAPEYTVTNKIGEPTPDANPLPPEGVIFQAAEKVIKPKVKREVKTKPLSDAVREKKLRHDDNMRNFSGIRGKSVYRDGRIVNRKPQENRGKKSS